MLLRTWRKQGFSQWQGKLVQPLGKQFGNICEVLSVHFLQPKNSALSILSGGNDYKIFIF